jgi:hypothetical protein
LGRRVNVLTSWLFETRKSRFFLFPKLLLLTKLKRIFYGCQGVALRTLKNYGKITKKLSVVFSTGYDFSCFLDLNSLQSFYPSDFVTLISSANPPRGVADFVIKGVFSELLLSLKKNLELKANYKLNEINTNL